MNRPRQVLPTQSADRRPQSLPLCVQASHRPASMVRRAVSVVGSAIAVLTAAALWAAEPSAGSKSSTFDAGKIAKIGPQMQKFVDDGEIAGAVTVVGGSVGVADLVAVGRADLERKTPMRPDSIFRIASMTKPITAIGIMILVDEGKLSVDDPVQKHLPEFLGQKLRRGGELVSPRRPITIADLLTHTSGMPGGLPPALAELYIKRHKPLAEGVRLAAREPLEFEPGTKWAYCNMGIDTLGRIIEVVAGQPYEEFLRRRVFAPLGMVDTCFFPSGAQKQRLAITYNRVDGKLVASQHDIIDLPPGAKYPIPAGGLYSTAADLARLYRMMLCGGCLDGKRILSRKSLQTMTAPHTGSLTAGFTPGGAFGYGWAVVTDPQGVTAMLSRGAFGHGGAFGTQGWIDPKQDLFFVLLIQRLGLPNADASDMRRRLQRLAVDSLASGATDSSATRNAASRRGEANRAGSDGDRTAGGLRLATFACDMTPPIGGQPIIWTTSVRTIEDPLWGKGIVLADGRNRYVVCTIDWCGLCNGSFDQFRRKLAAAAGTDVSRVALHCVHQHTAPYVDGDAQRLLDKTPEPPYYVDAAFMEDASDRLASGAKDALARLTPFDGVGYAEARVDRVASSRRIFTPDGKFHGRMSSAKDPALRALPEGAIDPMLRTITLASAGKPLVRMHYYATHPQSFYGDARASADVPGLARERLQKKDGVFQLYFTGCGGDVAMGKYNDGSRAARAELTDRLLAAMQTASAATKLVPADGVRWESRPLVLPLPGDFAKTLPDRQARMADPKTPVIQRVDIATDIAFGRRIGTPLSIELFQIGPVRVLHLPGETCLEFQRYAHAQSGGRPLAVAAYGDLGPGYICPAKAFKEGGYEPSASRVAPQSETVLKSAIQEILATGR